MKILLPLYVCIILVLATQSEKFQCEGLQSRQKALHFPTLCYAKLFPIQNYNHRH